MKRGAGAYRMEPGVDLYCRLLGASYAWYAGGRPVLDAAEVTALALNLYIVAIGLRPDYELPYRHKPASGEPFPLAELASRAGGGHVQFWHASEARPARAAGCCASNKGFATWVCSATNTKYVLWIDALGREPDLERIFAQLAVLRAALGPLGFAAAVEISPDDS